MTLLIFKERLKQFYSNYDFYIIPVVKLVCVLITLLMVNQQIGYMTQLKSVPVVGIISVICAVLPVSLIVVVISAVILAHLYALAMELAIIALIFFILMYLLYFRFTPGDGVVLFLVPVLFVLKIPYFVPLVVGLAATPVSIVSVAFGTMIYYMIHYVSENAVMITNVSSDSIMKKTNLLLTGIFKDKSMYLTMIVFALVIIVVYLIRRRSMDHAWTIAIIVGSIVNLTAFLLADILFSMNNGTGVGWLVAATVISAVLAEIYNLCFFAVDYSRTERLQFEDDEYYYYVKAVPKINVSVPEVNVKRINTRKTKRDNKTGKN